MRLFEFIQSDSIRLFESPLDGSLSGYLGIETSSSDSQATDAPRGQLRHEQANSSECNEWLRLVHLDASSGGLGDDSSPSDLRHLFFTAKREFPSQFGQEVHLLLALGSDMLTQNGNGERRTKVFVDVAAAWPQKLSNSYFLGECLGWQGVCVEADKHKTKALREERSCKLVERCVSDTDGKKVTFESDFNTGTNGIVRNGGSGDTIECLTLDTILRENMVRKVDFLSLDIEGSEWEALSGLSNKVRVEIIVMETASGWDPKTREKIAEWLDSHNYLPVMGHNPSLHPPAFHSTARQVLIDDESFQSKSAKWGLHDIFFVLKDSEYMPALVRYAEKLGAS